MQFKLSPHLSFFASRGRLLVYHDINGAVVRVREGVRQALLPLLPELEGWSGPGGAGDEPPERARERLLRWRIIVPGTEGPVPDLDAWYPARSVWSVFYVREDGEIVRARHDRTSGKPVLEPLQGLAAALWLACDGTRTFQEIFTAAEGDAARVRDLARAWTRPDRQLLKWLPAPLPQLSATEGFPVEFLTHTKDLVPLGRRPGDPGRAASLERARRRPMPSPSLARLYGVPHPALGGRTYGGALAAALVARGLLRTGGARVVELGAAGGELAAGFLETLEREAPAVAAGLRYTIIASDPAPRAAQRASVAGVPGHLKDFVAWTPGSAPELPIDEHATDLVIATGAAEGAGAAAARRRLLEGIARALAPGGAAILVEHGPGGPGRDGADLEPLLERAKALGFDAQLENVADVAGFNRSTPLLFADDVHLAELSALARSAGCDLPALAYTLELLKDRLGTILDIDRLANLSFATLGALAPLGVSPEVYRALLLRAA